MNLSKLQAIGSGYRSYAAGWALVGVGALGMAGPTYNVVFGDFGLTVEIWNLLQQAVTPLIGLAVIFLRSAIAKVSPMAADVLAPMIEKALTEAIKKLLKPIEPPSPKPDEPDLVFTPPVRLED